MEILALEKMKYKKDKLSYALCLLGIVLNVFYFCALYKNNDQFYSTWKIGISVIYNLIFMLSTFLAAENIKNYNYKYSIFVFVIAILQVARIFIYPKQALDAGALESSKYALITIYLCISATLLFASAIISFIKGFSLKKYVEKKELKKEQ